MRLGGPGAREFPQFWLSNPEQMKKSMKLDCIAVARAPEIQ
jgi:hypothetical protein